MSRRLHTDTVGQYRKLALWSGPFEQFLYIDVETVVLQPLSPLLQLLQGYEIVAGVSNLESIRKFVWRDSIDAENVTFDTTYAANTGFLISRRGVLSLNDAQTKLPDALSLKSHMALKCTEQPYLNYLIVTSGHRYSSLTQLRKEPRHRHLPKVVWSGRATNEVLGRENVAVVHWAGEWREGKHRSHRLWKEHHERHCGSFKLSEC